MALKNLKILIVDDDSDFLIDLSFHLQKNNFDVFTATNGNDAIAIARKEIPHLLILDINMPGMDGIELCKHLRDIIELNSSIIMFLTNCMEDYTQIAAFEAGADDYIMKPLKPELHLSRIRSILKRIDPTLGTPVSAVGDLIIDRDRFLIIINDKKFELPKKEFELLEFLTSRPGKVFTREEILESIWEEDYTVIHRTIDVHISKIREKIGAKYIKTIKGVGYKFDATIQ